MWPTEERDVRSGDAIVRFLIAQHRRIAHLFDETNVTRGPQREHFFRTLRWALATHETVEQTVLRPQTRLAVPDGDPWVRARMEEEAETRQTVSRLERLQPTMPEFDALLYDLQSDVMRHFETEERHEFAAVAPLLGPADLRRVEIAAGIPQPATDGAVPDRVPAAGYVDDTYVAMVEHFRLQLRVAQRVPVPVTARRA